MRRSRSPHGCPTRRRLPVAHARVDVLPHPRAVLRVRDRQLFPRGERAGEGEPGAGIVQFPVGAAGEERVSSTVNHDRPGGRRFRHPQAGFVDAGIGEQEEPCSGVRYVREIGFDTEPASPESPAAFDGRPVPGQALEGDRTELRFGLQGEALRASGIDRQVVASWDGALEVADADLLQSCIFLTLPAEGIDVFPPKNSPSASRVES